MKHHTIIYDKNQANLFFEKFLPEEGHCLVLSHVAREKYMRDERLISRSSTNLKVSIVNGTTDQCYKGLLSFCVPLETYSADFSINDEKVTKDIPSDYTVVYSTINHKNLLLGWKKTNSEVDDHLYNIALGHDSNFRMGSIHKKLFGNIESIPNKKKYGDIDVDTKSPDFIKDLCEYLLPLKCDITLIMETKNGYHIIFDRNTVNRVAMSKLYKFCKSTTFTKKNRLSDVTCTDTLASIKNDPMCPIPGTLQGGFPVRVCDIDTFFE